MNVKTDAKKTAPKKVDAKAAPKTEKKVATTKAVTPKARAEAPKEVAKGRAPSAKKPAPRADYGAPIDGFFTKQPPALRPIVDELRRIIDRVAPEATSSLKWGMPFYVVGKATLCAIGAHKSHVNLILSGPPGTFADPDGLLVGDGKTGRHLKLTSIDQLPKKAVEGWLKTAAARARKG